MPSLHPLLARQLREHFDLPGEAEGLAGFLQKPFRLKDLRALLQKVLTA